MNKEDEEKRTKLCRIGVDELCVNGAAEDGARQAWNGKGVGWEGEDDEQQRPPTELKDSSTLLSTWWACATRVGWTNAREG